MDESAGSEYALHIALQTLKDRCQNLQQQVLMLEERNKDLCLKCSNYEIKGELLADVDTLKKKITHLTDQKTKLKNYVSVVTNENTHLWNKLSNLTQINKSLASHLTKINESLNQRTKVNESVHPSLLRSKTFSHYDCNIDRSNETVNENDKISMELEDISLKLLSNIAREKTELENQSSEIAEIQSAIVANSFDFIGVNEKFSDTLVQDFDQHLNNLKKIRCLLHQQKEKIQKNIVNLKMVDSKVQESVKFKMIGIEGSSPKFREHSHGDIEETLQLESLAQWGSSKDILQQNVTKKINICPICSQVFESNKNPDLALLQHVENHFIETE